MVKYIFTILLCAYGITLSGQNTFPTYSNFASEAVLFSQPSVSGTGRTAALGGAHVSLGGDMTNISANPAGLGFYNRSSWSITPVLRLGVFQSENSTDQKNSAGLNFQIPNMGLVFHNTFDNANGWVSGTFGINYNQKSYFYNNINYRSQIEANDDGLIRDYTDFALQPFLYDSAGATYFEDFNTFIGAEDAILSDYYAELAYETGLLNIYEDVNGNFEVDRYDVSQNGYLTSSVVRTEEIKTTGGLTTVDLSYGANYQDKIFIGGALNLNFLNYEIDRSLRETPNNNLISSYTVDERRVLSGTGAGITLGIIYKPLAEVNIGFNYASPSFMVIEEVQTLTVTPFNNGFSEWEIVNEVPGYTFMSPQKVSVGATYFISKYGFVTADLNVVDYGNARYTTNQNAFGSEESDVSNQLKTAYHANIGGEARLGVIRARAGYAFYESPFIASAVSGNFSQERSVLTFGLGIKKKDFFLDAALNIENRNNPPIDAYNSGISTSSNTNMNVVRVSFGKTF